MKLVAALATMSWALWAVVWVPEPAAASPELFLRHCAECHGKLRYGGYAPPLIPDTLQRRSADQLAAAIRDGLPQTQMPAFRDKLSPDEIRDIATFVQAPVGPIAWSESDIAASRVVVPDVASAYVAPAHPEQIVLVVERGTGSMAVLDGATMAQLDKFYVGQIHGGPKFNDAFSNVFAATRDGTVMRYDLRAGQLRVKAKVAVNLRNIAVSPQGDWVAAANQLPRNLVIMDGALQPKLVVPLEGTPSAVYELPGQSQFVLTLRDLPRMMFVSYPSLQVRRVELETVFEDFTFIPQRPLLLASSRGGTQIVLYDLESASVRHRLTTSAMPHLFSATYFMRDGMMYAALNHIGLPLLSIINLDTFKVEKEVQLAGAGFFARTHPRSPYLWVDTNTDRIQLIDKATLNLVERAVIPDPGKKAMHVEFTADGGKALVSVWDTAGAVVVYDAVTTREIQRLPFNMPIGKYNALNKTHFPLR